MELETSYSSGGGEGGGVFTLKPSRISEDATNVG